MIEKETERILKSLANRRRLAIVRLLRKGKRVSVTDIANEIKLSVKATSKHLSVLAAAGITDREQKSKQIFYFISKDIHKFSSRIIDDLPT